MTPQQACTNRVYPPAAARTVLRPNPSHPRTLRTMPLPLPPCLLLALVFSFLHPIGLPSPYVDQRRDETTNINAANDTNTRGPMEHQTHSNTIATADPEPEQKNTAANLLVLNILSCTAQHVLRNPKKTARYRPAGPGG